MVIANILKRIKNSINFGDRHLLISQELMSESLIRLDFSIASLKKSTDELFLEVDLGKLLSFVHSYQDVRIEIEGAKVIVPEKFKQILEDFSDSMLLFQKGKAKIIFYPDLENGDIDLKLCEVKRCIENSQHIKHAIDVFRLKFKEEYSKIKV
jgi:hypothetical protein